MTTAEELWETVLGELELQVSRPNFLTWLKNSKLAKMDDAGSVFVALPNHFAKEWVSSKYNKIILGSLRTHKDSIKKVEYIVEGSLVKARPKIQPQSASAEKKQLIFQEMRVDPETNLNPKYTMGSFVVGPSNELAFNAASAIIQSVGVKYNPFFIYGGVGLGKTHLIQAMGNEIKLLYGGKVKVKYVSSEKFTSDVVWAIRNRRMEDIKAAYRHIDVLIIDDIQFIGGKEKTEEEFFHTFNALYENNKHIIISSDRPPKAIPTLEERLSSRFQAGITVDVGLPEYETRVAIIRTKMQERGVTLSDETVDLIAKKAQKNIREIEGILNKLVFHQSAYSKDLSAPIVEKIINEITQKAAPNITPTQVINTVASFFEISPNELISKSRNKQLIEPRQITIYILRNVLNMSYPYIAAKIGNRDHTTAIYSHKKISDQLPKDTNLQRKLETIKEELNKLG
ncbi:MAG: chromosomal replication initiator protein DnaA [Candidatus Colwellbacteria bacterium]|nr:chromosomal replication initiator protein DnaA [Candidatus Colwellbacteria bacterium]